MTDENNQDRDAPPIKGIEEFNKYIRFIDVLPDDVKDRIAKHAHPLTGEQRNYRYDNYVLLAEIHHLHDSLCRVPTTSDLEKKGTISLPVYLNRFGTFQRAVEAAGFEPVFTTEQQKARYLAEYQDLADPDEAKPWSN
ncbi:homing endonuclease associated repeat-containing protein [Natrinema halophilum]|uniref:homing endonuclease associated repeat-containing protein n=1 Tax=Natrinema halophilum TaxID=1699371 RepID=UPI001F1D923C|nr:hypothetical protein [Natrinema halophilum]UHQ96451.1 hypothetical protein HYG82_23715 [Natrinema halophilum]